MIQSTPSRNAVSDVETQRLWDARSDVESFLRELRQRGARQIESIHAVRQLLQVDLAEAKKIVHFSLTWADMRDSAEALHEAAYKALEQIDRVEREEEAEPARLAS